MRHKASPDPAVERLDDGGTSVDPKPSTVRYRRMSRAEKLNFAAGGKAYSMFRCKRCRVQVEARDRAQHLERCWPEVLMQRFAKVS